MKMNNGMKLKMGKVCVLKREMSFLVWLEDRIKMIEKTAMD